VLSLIKALRRFWPPGQRRGYREALEPARVRVPLPEGLRRNLGEIARREVSCGEVERLYSALGGAEDPAAARHLESCPRCRPIYTALETAIKLPPRPLPAALSFRLAGIPRRAARRERPKALDRWLFDLRFAAAMSAFLTTLFIPAFAQVRQHLPVADEGWRASSWGALTSDAGTVEAMAVVWWQTVEPRGREVVVSFSESAQAGARRGRENLAAYGLLWGRLIEDSTRFFNPSELGRKIFDPELFNPGDKEDVRTDDSR